MDIVMGALLIFGVIILVGSLVVAFRSARGSKRDEYRDRLRESGVSEEEITRREKATKQGKRW